MILTPVRARSAGDEIFPGLSAGITIVRTLPANATVGPSASDLSVRFLGFDVSADRKTSAGALCSIWVSRAADESVEILNTEPGWVASQATFILSSAPFSEAAPKIVSGAAPAEVEVDGRGGADGRWAGVVQAATAIRAVTSSHLPLDRLTTDRPGRTGSRR